MFPLIRGEMMREIRWYVGLPLATISALLLLFSYPTYNLNFLAFFALAPILYVTYRVDLKKTLAYGIVFAFLFYCLYLFWMNAYLAIVGVLFVTVIFGGFFVLSLLVINLSSRAFPNFRVILTPFIWIGFDYIRSFGFLGLTFGSIGYTQHNFLRFIQLADIGGEQIIAFILVLFNAAFTETLAWLIDKKPFREKKLSPGVSIPLYCAVGLFVLSLIYGTVKLAQPIPGETRMKLSMIQGLSSPRTKWKKEKWKTLRTLTSLTRESYQENDGVDLVVWTETAIRTSLRPNLIYGTAYHGRIQRLIQEIGTHFIIGSPDNYYVGQDGQVTPENLEEIYPTKGEEEIWTNSAYFLNPEGEIIGKYDKRQLTPFGEHFPLGKKIPFLQKILDKFTDSAGFTSGNSYTVFDHSKLKFGVVICWEGTYGYFIRHFVKNGADFILNISNDMWTQTEAGHFQHFTITKFRAVENRIWYARAANDGVTAIINPHGMIVKILPIKETGYLVGEVGPRVKTTFYTKYGDILPRVSLAVLCASLLFSIIVLIKRRNLPETGI
jgi:apolipoprotein N-acyltransferase